MPTLELPFEEWCRASLDDIDLGEDGRPRRPVVIVTDADADADADADERGQRVLRGSRAPGPVVIVVAEDASGVSRDLASRADVVVTARPDAGDAVSSLDPIAEARRVAEKIERRPVAALTLAWLLRAEQGREVPSALLAESTAYSTLLASREFRDWLRGRRRRPPGPGTTRVDVRRDGDRLLVTMNNPGRRNAMDARMRDELLEALQPALWDPHLTVELGAAGPTAGSGGDLDEFGSATDVGLAHLTRSTASLGLALTELRERVVATVHGACFGAGIEVPAFAGALVASSDATFTLPELSMGLIPGAGGTVSISRRIGRWRTAWLAMSGSAVDAPTALAWGLVDRVE